jgi:hypothetical protein
MAYWTVLLESQIIWRQTVGWLLDNELQTMWEKAAMAWFETLFRDLPTGIEEKHGKASVWRVGIWVEIRTVYYPNASQKRYRLRQFAWSYT